MSFLNSFDGHSDLLEDAFFDLVRDGTVVVSISKLLRWTDTKRVTPKLWKYINQVFNAVLEHEDEHKHGYKLYVGVGAGTYTFLIWDRGVGEDAVTLSWWESIEDLEQPKKRRKAGIDEDVEIEVEG